MTVRVAIVDDHELFRSGVRAELPMPWSRRPGGDR